MCGNNWYFGSNTYQMSLSCLPTTKNGVSDGLLPFQNSFNVIFGLHSSDEQMIVFWLYLVSFQHLWIGAEETGSPVRNIF